MISDEYQMREINLDKLADHIRTEGNLDEAPALHLLDTIRVMRQQMAEIHAKHAHELQDLRTTLLSSLSAQAGDLEGLAREAAAVYADEFPAVCACGTDDSAWLAAARAISAPWQAQVEGLKAENERLVGVVEESSSAAATAQELYNKAFDRAEAAEQERDQLKAQLAQEWVEGKPPFPYGDEWFIALTTYGDRVVLKALPKEHTYDYKTADETFFKADKIKAWRQFPDSEFKPYADQLKTRVAELEKALTRLGSVEAMTSSRVMDPVRDAELIARIDYARATLERRKKGRD